MRLVVLGLFLPLTALAADRVPCVTPADRVANVAKTCASAKSTDCVPDLVLALRTGTPEQASNAAELLANRRGVTLALGWALESKNVSETAAQKVAKALQAACDQGDKAACVVRRDALSSRSGSKDEVDWELGELSRADLERSIRRNRPLAEHCYTRHLACDPKAKGRVIVRVHIHETGVASWADVMSGFEPAIDACVLATLVNYRFPRPDGGDFDVSFPIVFPEKK